MRIPTLGTSNTASERVSTLSSSHSRRSRRAAGRTAILLIAALGLVALGLFSRAAAAQSSDVLSSSTLNSAAQIQAYWTPERMAKAKPMPVPLLSGGPHPASVVTPTTKEPLVVAPSGKPGTSASVLVGSAAEAALGQAAVDGVTPQFAAGQFPYARYRLFPNTDDAYTRFPYSAMGQLFFTIPGFGDFVCSGSSVNSPNASVIWTAGHCVYTPGIGFHNNFLYAPARHEPRAPLGLWTGSQAFTTRQWSNGQFEFDHGAIVANRGGHTGERKKLADVTGFLGFMANASFFQQWNLDGWPVGARDKTTTPPGQQFDGLHHEICLTVFGRTDDPSQNGGSVAIAVGCDQTGGTSGGPWVVDFSGVDGNTNFVNGNNSYRYTGPNPPENLKLHSPYFGPATVAVWEAARAVVVP
jgi:V8-like Glu-specific endopeptidase